ncbi:MAG: nucleoside-diphosphate kinase [Patescibacteria group bacterium]
MEHPKNEKSLVLIKPDGVQRSMIGEIIKRFEQTGLKLCALKMVFATEDQSFEHYYKEDDWFENVGQKIIDNKKEKGDEINKSAIEYGKDVQKALVEFLTVGPVVAMVWQGNAACEIIRKIVGGTEPTSSDVGTIRGDYTVDSYKMANLDNRAVRNLIHASEVPEDAEREIKIWFSENEILKYILVQDKILYDVNLDGIKE